MNAIIGLVVGVIVVLIVASQVQDDQWARCMSNAQVAPVCSYIITGNGPRP